MKSNTSKKRRANAETMTLLHENGTTYFTNAIVRGNNKKEEFVNMWVMPWKYFTQNKFVKGLEKLWRDMAERSHGRWCRSYNNTSTLLNGTADRKPGPSSGTAWGVTFTVAQRLLQTLMSFKRGNWEIMLRRELNLKNESIKLDLIYLIGTFTALSLVLKVVCRCRFTKKLFIEFAYCIKSTEYWRPIPCV
jgi:hypothetical protein